jgi:peptidyl-prolyl cis-trans isomerase SurA
MPAPARLRRLAGSILAAGLIVSLSAVGSTEILEQILVKVNGEIFTKTELEARQVAYLRQRGQQLTDEELRKQVTAITPQLLVDSIDEMLLLQRGKELGYRLTDEQFSAWLANVKKENKIETEEQFGAALKQENLTIADLRKQVERGMIIDRVQQAEVLGRINLTEPEERKYYAEHPAEFTSPATITLREILVKTPGDSKTLNVGLNEETKAKAEKLRAQLVAGGDFEKAVAEVSAAPSKANAGLVGPLNLNELNPALATPLKSLKTGDISQVIPVQGGYDIFKVESSAPPAVLAFDQARGQIAEKIVNQRRQGEFEKYIRKLRAGAIIEWKNADLRKLYEQKIAAPATRGAGH